MKPKYGSGKHNTVVPQITLNVANTVVQSTHSFCLEVCYDWDEGCKGDSEQPAEQEWFEINSIKPLDRIELVDQIGLSLTIWEDTELISILDESYIDRLTIKVIKELREEANE